MREIFNLNEKWAFSKEAIKPPVAMPQNWYWVNLPHTWNAIDVETITTVEPVFMRKKSRKRNFRRENSIIWNFWE